MGLAAAAAGIRTTHKSLMLAGWSSWRTWAVAAQGATRLGHIYCTLGSQRVGAGRSNLIQRGMWT